MTNQETSIVATLSLRVHKDLKDLDVLSFIPTMSDHSHHSEFQEPDLPLIIDVQKETIYGEYIGHCKWFNNKLGYGFIRVCTGALKGADIFVHHSGLKPLNSSFKTMYKGEYVNFNIIEGRNGKQAVDVTGIFGGPLMCDNITNRATPFSFTPPGFAIPPGFPTLCMPGYYPGEIPAFTHQQPYERAPIARRPPPPGLFFTQT